MAKSIGWCLTLLLFMTMIALPDYAAAKKGSFSGRPSSHSTQHSGSFSGNSSSSSHTGSGKVYSSGPKAPSSNVTNRSNVQSPSSAQSSKPSSHWGSFFGGLAAGALIGHFFHPFGGAGYGGSGGFSFLSIIMWILIIFIGYKLLRRLFWRN